MHVLANFYHFQDMDPDLVTRFQDAGGNFLLDSGAYPLYAKLERGDSDETEAESELNELFDKYTDWCSEVDGKIDGYFQMDFPGKPDKSEEMYTEMKSRGLDPIAVWQGDVKSLEGFEDWIEGKGYVAIGGSVKGSQYSTTAWYKRKRMAKFYKAVGGRAKVHLLGAGDKRTVRKICPYSCDSTNYCDFWQPRAKIKIYNRRLGQWHRMRRKYEKWDNFKAIDSILDTLNMASFDDVMHEIKNECGRYTFSPLMIATYCGWFPYSNKQAELGRTKMYCAFKNRRQMACCGYVGWKAGWLDKDYFEWVIDK